MKGKTRILRITLHTGTSSLIVLCLGISTSATAEQAIEQACQA